MALRPTVRPDGASFLDLPDDCESGVTMTEIFMLALVYLLGALYVSDQFEAHSSLSGRLCALAEILWPILAPIVIIAGLILEDGR